MCFKNCNVEEQEVGSSVIREHSIVQFLNILWYGFGVTEFELLTPQYSSLSPFCSAVTL